MQFTKDQIAPATGFYKVVAPDGTILGRLKIEIGGLFPPAESAYNLYEFENDIN